MSDTNGSGRLDRIEAILDQMAQRQEAFDRRFDAMVAHHEAEFKQLMTWQVLTQDQIREMSVFSDETNKRLAKLSEQTDKRVSDLVSAIGELIKRIPLPQ